MGAYGGGTPQNPNMGNAEKATERASGRRSWEYRTQINSSPHSGGGRRDHTPFTGCPDSAP